MCFVRLAPRSDQKKIDDPGLQADRTEVTKGNQMFSSIRKTFGPAFVGLIIGFIAFVFIFYGIFNPKATRGLHEGSVAGLVNGDKISLSEFNRAYEQRVEMFKSFGGGKISEEQLRMFRVRESVFESLVDRKLLAQQSRAMGISAGDEQVKTAIREMPVFRNEGGFDPLKYEQVLRANRYSPSSFEEMMREDLSIQALQQAMRGRARVSEEEIREEFLRSQDKRDIKYVLLTSDMGRKRLKLDPEEVKKYLADEKNVNILKGQFDRKKDTEFKGKEFEAVKQTLAEDQIGRSKVTEIRAESEKLADELLALLGKDKAADDKLNARIKDLGAAIKTTGMIARVQGAIPGLGESKDLLSDAFAGANTISLLSGGKAKRYSTPAGVVIAAVVAVEKPDESKLSGERGKLLESLTEKKQGSVFSSWLKDVRKKAKIEPNPDVVSPDGKDAG
jgi:hypothetical protein